MSEEHEYSEIDKEEGQQPEPAKEYSVEDEIKQLQNSTKQNSNFFSEIEYEETIEPTEEIDTEEEEYVEIEDIGAEDEEPTENENSSRNAKLITGWFDSIFSSLLMFWSKEKSNDQFKADKSSLKEVEKNLKEGFDTITDFSVPWWMGLTMVVPMAYGPKIKKAWEKRKFNKAAEKQRLKNVPSLRREPTKQASQEQASQAQSNNQCQAYGCEKDKGKNKQFCSTQCRVNMLNEKNKGNTSK